MCRAYFDAGPWNGAMLSVVHDAAQDSEDTCARSKGAGKKQEDGEKQLPSHGTPAPLEARYQGREQPTRSMEMRARALSGERR